MSVRQWLTGRRSRRPIRKAPSLHFEALEPRTTPTAAINDITDFVTPLSRDLLVPVSLVSDPGTLVNYTVSSNNGDVTASLVNRQRSLELDVTGTDAMGQAFSGTLTLALFEDAAPLATGRIITLTERPDGPGNQGNYDGTIFHRIVDNFVIQGGDMQFGNGTGGSNLGTFPDEIRSNLTFNSPGLLALANSGPNTNNSQFFITDIDRTPFQQPQHLNGLHTIFGILTGGFDTYEKIITTPVGSNSRPISPVTITDAEIVNDFTRGVLRISPGSGFEGASTITVMADDGTGPSQTSFDVTFSATATPPPTTPPPPTSPPTTPPTSPPTTPPPPTSPPTTPPTTPPPPVAITLPFASDDGLFPDDGIVENDTPRLTISAPTGSTVNFRINGGGQLLAGESGDEPATFVVNVPARTLRVGANTIEATVDNGGEVTNLDPFSVTYAPSLKDRFVVPGDLGTTQTLLFEILSDEGLFNNEFGLYIADDSSGTVNGIAPGAPGYAGAVLSSSTRQVIFSPSDAVGTANRVSFNAGATLGFYLVRNATTDALLSSNPTNNATGDIVAFFSFEVANPDSAAHLVAVDDPLNSQGLYAWEDLFGSESDFDYNDLVIAVRPDGQPLMLREFTRVPGPNGREISLSFTLEEATKSPTSSNPSTSDTAPGEVGLFFVDGPDGSIGNLTPNTPGYTLAALAPDRRQQIFAGGVVASTSTTLNLEAGRFFGVYFIPGGTAEGWRTGNPANNPAISQVAFFSPDAANPDDAVHVRTVAPEGVTIGQPTDDLVRFHLMGTFDGGLAEFDDVVFSMRVNG